MAQRVAGLEKRSAAGVKAVIDVDSIVKKRLMQGRLPFKPLDCKPPTPATTNNNATKKRKFSSPDSPGSKPKLPKLPDVRQSSEKLRPLQLNNDNEVSSSSEADNLLTGGGASRATKNNLLEKFVRREDEITSTNDVIDLTELADETEPDENSPAKAKSPRKPVLKSPMVSAAVPKEKSEDHFVRKLVFDEDKTAAKGKKGGEDVSKTVSPTEGEEQGTCGKSEAMETEVCIDLCEEGENAMQVDGDENTDAQTPNTSVLETSAFGSGADAGLETSGADAGLETSGAGVGLETSGADAGLETSGADADLSTPEKENGEKSMTETAVSKKCPLSTSTAQTQKSSDTSCVSTDGTTPTTDKKKKPLSKKQEQRTALRQKVKEDKERQKQEAKDQKEKERLEKKRKRDEEKAEKDRAKMEEKEKKEKERLEKKEQTEKEKREKMEQKEEERKKKLEQINMKSEEKKKKEEEKKQKEEQKQKEEEEKLRQAEKRKVAFTSFFMKPKVVSSSKVDKAVDNLFIPFEVKKDMTLAPVRRQVLSQEMKQLLDDAVQTEEGGVTYLDQIRQGELQPVRTNRVLRKKIEVEQEVELLVHDSEAVKKVTHAVKVLQFHTDYRPPYYGTWRKRHTGLSPRNPWKKYEDVFDYEVDSDEEWEEEEPGESLSDSNGEEEEGEEDEEGGDEDGWMVPHGYLSEGEGCEDDEEVTPEVLKARQRAKALAWETELKAKRQVAAPVHLGCFWLDRPCVCSQHLNILRDFEMICLRASPVETLISSPAASENSGDRSTDKPASRTTPNPKGFRKRALPEEAMPDLIRLVHGNSFGIQKLIREFRLYWKKKSNDPNATLDESQMEEEMAGDALNKSAADTSVENTEQNGEAEDKQNADSANVQPECMQTETAEKETGADKPENKQNDSTVGEDTNDRFVSKRQLEMKISAIAVREKREGKKKCWYVHENILQQYNVVDLPAENSWVYVSSDMTRKTPNKAAEKKTPNKPGKQKTPNKAGEKNSLDDSNKKERLAEEGVDTTAPHQDKNPTGKETTPKARKNKKEIVVKKATKDQPSIMAFAKKTPTQATAEQDQPKNVPTGPASKTDATADAAMETETEVKTKNKTVVEAEHSEMDDDCIVLD